MHTIRNSHTIAMQALSLFVLYGSIALGMNDTGPQITKWNIKSAEHVKSFPYKQPIPIEKTLYPHFFAKEQAHRWASGTPHPKCTLLPLENLYNSNDSVSSPQAIVTSCFSSLNLNGPACTYAGIEAGKLILGHSNGSVSITNTNASGIWENNFFNYNASVSACAFGDPFSIGSYQDQRSMLVGYADRSLMLVDRKKRQYQGFYRAHPEPITSIMAGHVPNMWVVGGGSYVTVTKFEQDQSLKVVRKFTSLCFGINAVTPLPVQVVGLYKCGIVIRAENGSNTSDKLIMPYSPDEYAAIQECQSSPSLTDCVLRIIAAKKAGTCMDFSNYKFLPPAMQTMLLKS